MTRPYFFQQDSARLLASIAASEPQATGSASNSTGQPLGFITAMTAKLATPASWTDIDDCYMAPAGWLTANSSMRAVAKSACLALVRRIASPIISGDEYQHIEDMMLRTAMVVDACYADFSGSERTEVSTWINDVLNYAESQRTTFWPLANSPHNNYWQNHFLALSIAGLCGEGWLANVSTTWRPKFETWAAIVVTQYTSPDYTGPQITEGHYYSAYTYGMLWALRQYDAVMGTTYTSQLSFGPVDALNLALFQVRPHNGLFFSIGSEAANAIAPFHGVQWRLWHQLIMLSGPSNATAGVAFTMLGSTEVTSEANNFWSRSAKAWDNFYWRIYGTTPAALSTKSDRRLVLPSPGGAQTYLRSSQGWSTSATRRAAVVFHSRVVWASGNSRYPDYSHAHVDIPGFQWAQDTDWLVLDPEASGGGGISGIDGELGGSSVLSDISNIVTLASAKYTSSTAYPTTTHNEDNTGAAIPHYYLNIDASPYWTMCTVYRRQYVWLDDMQVCVLWDRVATSGADTKTLRMHVMGLPVVASGVATTTTPGSQTVKVRDLYSTTGNAMTRLCLGSSGTLTSGTTNSLTDSTKAWITNELVGYTVIYDVSGSGTFGTIASNIATTVTISGSWTAPTAGMTYRLGPYAGASRITQVDAANDFRSLKVLDVGGRVSAATLSSGAGYLQADMTINGVSRSVRMFDDGSHATVS